MESWWEFNARLLFTKSQDCQINGASVPSIGEISGVERRGLGQSQPKKAPLTAGASGAKAGRVISGW